jgi:hypothetical protein
MKVAIIISEGVKQIMFTPENDQEKLALKLISPNDSIELAVKQQVTFYSGSNSRKPAGYSISMCRGGYLRAWEDENSVMLVLTPKSEAADETLEEIK